MGPTGGVDPPRRECVSSSAVDAPPFRENVGTWTRTSSGGAGPDGNYTASFPVAGGSTARIQSGWQSEALALVVPAPVLQREGV